MISFMVIGMPRSGTTWAANWLTTDKMRCLHDPLWTHHYTDWDSLESGNRVMGVSCTGIGFWPQWLNQHPARKVILHRDIREINNSLLCNLLPRWSEPMNLDAIEGLHVHWQELFEAPKKIFSHLLPDFDFDEERHSMLVQMNIEPHIPALGINQSLCERLMSEITPRPVPFNYGVPSCLGV